MEACAQACLHALKDWHSELIPRSETLVLIH